MLVWNHATSTATWQYPNIRGDLVATCNPSGTKVGATVNKPISNNGRGVGMVEQEGRPGPVIIVDLAGVVSAIALFVVASVVLGPRRFELLIGILQLAAVLVAIILNVTVIGDSVVFQYARRRPNASLRLDGVDESSRYVSVAIDHHDGSSAVTLEAVPSSGAKSYRLVVGGRGLSCWGRRT